MSTPDPYLPFAVFLPPGGSGRAAPRAFIAPHRYVQGPGVLQDVGRYLSITPIRRVAILMSARAEGSEGRTLRPLRSATSSPAWATPWPPGTRHARASATRRA